MCTVVDSKRKASPPPQRKSRRGAASKVDYGEASDASNDGSGSDSDDDLPFGYSSTAASRQLALEPLAGLESVSTDAADRGRSRRGSAQFPKSHRRHSRGSLGSVGSGVSRGGPSSSFLDGASQSLPRGAPTQSPLALDVLGASTIPMYSAGRPTFPFPFPAPPASSLTAVSQPITIDPLALAASLPLPIGHRVAPHFHYVPGPAATSADFSASLTLDSDMIADLDLNDAVSFGAPPAVPVTNAGTGPMGIGSFPLLLTSGQLVDHDDPNWQPGSPARAWAASAHAENGDVEMEFAEFLEIPEDLVEDNGGASRGGSPDCSAVSEKDAGSSPAPDGWMIFGDRLGKADWLDQGEALLRIMLTVC